MGGWTVKKTTRQRTRPAPAAAAPAALLQLADLVPDPHNRRQRTDRSRDMLTDAMQKVGPARSIVIDEHNGILAGNGVVEAATAAGLTKLQVVDADGQTLIAVRRVGLTPDQKRDLAIYDNRTAELAEWSMAQLAEDLQNGEDLAAFFLDGELATMGVLGQPVRDPQAEWSGMPEFVQKTLGAYHSIAVHFKDEASLIAFGQLIGQAVGKTVRYLWVPAQVDEVFKDKRYK